MAKAIKEEKKTITLFLTKKLVKLDNGTQFYAYKTPIGKLSVDVRFTKDSEYKIDGDGYFDFDVEDVNINTKGEYPVIWVK